MNCSIISISHCIIYLILFSSLFLIVAISQDTTTIRNLSAIDENVSKVELSISNAIEKRSPDLKFMNLETKTMQSLTDYLGKTVLLKFWNRGCKSCEAEMHDVSRLQRDYSKRGLVVIYVCNLEVEDASRFFMARKVDGNTIYGIKATVSEDSLMPPFQCLVIPMSIIIDREGIIRDGWLRQTPYQKFEVKILPFLDGSKTNWTMIVISICVIIFIAIVVIRQIRVRRSIKNNL